MKRRRSDPLETIPADLREYRASEWGSLREWCDARSEWAAVHGWPGGALARIRQQREIRLGSGVSPVRRVQGRG